MSNLNKKRYMLYFVDPIVATASFGEKEDDYKNNARKLLRKEFSMFDIRQGFHLPLLQTDFDRQSIMQSPRREYSASGMDNISNEVKISKSLICQLERNDLMYDVYQLSSLELTIQISVFSRKDFKKISAATVTRAELVVELEKDRKSHLLEG
jgi:ribosome-binding protein aMBF1 (putative translation factor)